jgi:hypothetical protein
VTLEEKTREAYDAVDGELVACVGCGARGRWLGATVVAVEPAPGGCPFRGPRLHFGLRRVYDSSRRAHGPWIPAALPSL